VSTFTPDYSVEFLPTNPWIHQPFEGYDAMRPEQLIQKWSVLTHPRLGRFAWPLSPLHGTIGRSRFAVSAWGGSRRFGTMTRRFTGR
jgi:hypothetical protein